MALLGCLEEPCVDEHADLVGLPGFDAVPGALVIDRCLAPEVCGGAVIELRGVVGRRDRRCLDLRVEASGEGEREQRADEHELHGEVLFAVESGSARAGGPPEEGPRAAVFCARNAIFVDALAETIHGLYKTERIYPRGLWRTLEAVELATLAWVDGFNHRRLLEPIGHVPQAEYEAAYDRAQQDLAMAA